MNIHIDELAQILDLCRKKGVSLLKMEGLEISLVEQEPRKRKKLFKETQGEIKTHELTDDEVLFYSSPMISEGGVDA